jgi:uncharacterized membrane protein
MELLLLSISIAAWGVAVFLMKIAGQGLGAYTSLIFTLPGYLIVMALVAGKADYSLSWRHGIPVLVGALYTIGNIAFYKLCETWEVSRMAPASALYVAIPVILGWIALREPVSMQRIAGLVFAALALYCLTAPERGGAVGL